MRGGCQCGRTRYEVDARPFHETVCHCVDCRRSVGAASVAWYTVVRSAFRYVAGSPADYRSSSAATRSFCPVCGTPLTFAHDGLPDEIDVTTASLDDPNAVPPRDHTWARRKLAWTVLNDGLPVFDGSRD